MKNLITLVLLGIASFSFSQIADKAENISPLLIGEQIPNVKIRDVEGELIETCLLYTSRCV